MVLAAAVLLAQASIAQAPVRARDPWVFRATFEDRPRQLIVSLGSIGKEKPLWVAFNPSTCAVRKVWRGQVDFRGKVYDFSQENSRAQGDVLVELREELQAMPTDSHPDWSATGMRIDQGWRFERDGAMVLAPPIRSDGYLTRYASFDEFGNRGRIQFRIVDANGKSVQEFQSSGSGLGPNSWQWNYKELQPIAVPHRFEISVPKAEDGKRIRNFRVFGDPFVWFRGAEPAEVDYRGYRVDGKESVTVMMNIGGVDVTWRPEAVDGGWTETFTLANVPPEGLRYVRSDGNGTVSAAADARILADTGEIRFTRDGTYTFRVEG